MDKDIIIEKPEAKTNIYDQPIAEKDIIIRKPEARTNIYDKVKPKLITTPSYEDTRHDVKALDDNDRECVVCMDNKPQCITMPCMHIRLCIECGIKMGKDRVVCSVECPVCKTGIVKIERVFL